MQSSPLCHVRVQMAHCCRVPAIIRCGQSDRPLTDLATGHVPAQRGIPKRAPEKFREGRSPFGLEQNGLVLGAFSRNKYELPQGK